MPILAMTALVLAAAMAAAILAMIMIMVMAAVGSGHIAQRTFQEGLYSLIGIAGYTGIQTNARLREGLLGPCTDAAADEGIHVLFLQEGGQGAMAAALGGNNHAGRHSAI